MSRTLLLSAYVGSLLLSACAREEPATAVTPSESATLPIPAPADGSSTAEIPAESSLALKRGTLTIAADIATFTPCGEQHTLFVIDQTGGLNDIFANDPKPLELYVEAHGERGPTPPDIAAARAYRGVFLLEELLYATPPGEGQGCAQPAPTYVVSARGNEPFWSAEVTGEQLIWRQPDEPREVIVEAVQSEDAEGAVGYSGAANGGKLELFVEQQACRDSMSGAYFAYSARATFDGKPFKGCARIGE